jgi:hypothetical protein
MIKIADCIGQCANEGGQTFEEWVGLFFDNAEREDG